MSIYTRSILLLYWQPRRSRSGPALLQQSPAQGRPSSIPCCRDGRPTSRRPAATRSTTSRSARAAVSRRSRPARSTSARPTSRCAAKSLRQRASRNSRSVIGGVVPVINIPGARPGQVKLERPAARRRSTRARSRRGTTRESPRSIRACTSRPRRSLPSTGRTVPARPSTSSTTSARSARAGSRSSAKARPCHGLGGIGGKGNEGVAGYVKQIPYSIGYVEYAYVVAEQAWRTR